jgi:hypothetical protein
MSRKARRRSRSQAPQLDPNGQVRPVHGARSNSEQLEAKMALSAEQGPFTPVLNAALEEAFGQSIAGLHVHRGADAQNRAIGACARTEGSTIFLSSTVREDLQDPQSMEVIGHEVGHALAGGGSGADQVDRPGDPGEARADAAGEGFAAYVRGGGRGRVPMLAPAHGGRAKVHRYKLCGPFNFGDPVHENLTLQSLRKASLEKRQRNEPMGPLLSNLDPETLPSPDGLPPKKFPKESQEFVRGTIFPDDPKNFLFNKSKGTDDMGTGLEWAWHYKFGGKKDLTARSHHGDLQFLHSMANGDGEEPVDTKARILAWARFNADVAKGNHGPGRRLQDVPEIAEYFSDDKYAERTVADLFAGHTKWADDLELPDLQQRATGALLHLVQDSFAPGHVSRDPETKKIFQFHSYTHQDEHKHGQHDKLAKGKSLGERLNHTPGANDAIHHGAKVLGLLDGPGFGVDDVVDYLDRQVFDVDPMAHLSGPGEHCQKKKKKKKKPKKVGEADWRGPKRRSGTDKAH